MTNPKKKSIRGNSKTASNRKALASIDENKDIVLEPTICADWSRLWSSFGFSDYQWRSRAGKVEEYTRKLIDGKVSIYKEQLVKRQTLLKQSLDDYEDLISRTGLLSSINKDSFDRLKLKEQESYVEKLLQDLLIEEGHLLHQRTELENEQKQLCLSLNASPIEFDENVPISLVETNEKLQEHIQMLNDLKDHRLKQISSYYNTLQKYAQQLDWTPTSSTMTHLFHNQFESCLTADCLNEIERNLHSLETRIQEQKAQFIVLRDQLTHLYERLNKDPQKDFCSAYHVDCENVDASIIKQLEDEIRRCREERLQHGKKYCQTMNEQISVLLEKAYLGDDYRAILKRLSAEHLSSDLLDAYDAEFERLTKLYQTRKPLLDAYEKWLAFWNDFVAFTKSSTDPARFRTRGYNAQAEGRKRKKFLRELPMIEQEFLNVLSEYKDEIFLIGDVPIQQKYEQAHHQVPASALPSATTARTVVGVTGSPRVVLTPSQSRSVAVTPGRGLNKGPLALASALAQRTAKTPAKTPGITPSRKLPNKTTSRTEHQLKRAKPRPVPLPDTTQTHPIPELPIHPPARTDDQVLDFSLVHTVKNIHGQVKIMTSTPNSSLLTIEKTRVEQMKTAHNAIERRRSKRRSNRTPNALLVVPHTPDDTVPCI